MAMFSLVTALVSPSVMTTLQNKRDTLVTLLKEKAGVLCTEPSGGMCLIQGQWDNIKKAHALLEEFYLQVQAEQTVRETLRTPNTGAVQPMLSFNMGESRSWSSLDDTSKPKKHHVYVHPQSNTKLEPSERESETPTHYHAGRGSADGRPQSHNPGEPSQATDPNGNTRSQSLPGVGVASNDVEVISDDGEQGNVSYGEQGSRASDSPPHLTQQDSLSHPIYSADSRTVAAGDNQAPLLSPTGSYSSYGSTAETVLSQLGGMQYSNNTQYKNALTIGATTMSTPPPPSLYNVNSAAQAAAHALGYGMLYPPLLHGIKQEPQSSGDSDASIARQADVERALPKKNPTVSPVSGNGSSDYRCDICGRVFKSEVRMKEHKRIHNDNLVNHTPCPKCGKMFTYRHNMIVHLRRFHYGLQPAKRHVCKQCGVRFLKPYMLRDHEEKVHHKPSVVVKKYVCTQCGAVFNNKNALAGHCSKVHINDSLATLRDNNNVNMVEQAKQYAADIKAQHYEIPSLPPT